MIWELLPYFLGGAAFSWFIFPCPQIREAGRERKKKLREALHKSYAETGDLNQAWRAYQAAFQQQRVAQLYAQYQQQSFQQTYQQVFGGIQDIHMGMGKPPEPIEIKFEVLKSEPKQLTEGEPLDHPSE